MNTSAWLTMIFVFIGLVIIGIVIDTIWQRRKAGKNYSPWLVVENLGSHGLRPLARFRARDRAESYRRRLANSGRSIEVVKYETWQTAMLEILHDPTYWDMKASFTKLSDQVETTLLPVVPEEVKQTPEFQDEMKKSMLKIIEMDLEELLSAVERLERRQTNTEDSVKALREAIVEHTEKTGHVTGELKAITEEDERDSHEQSPEPAVVSSGTVEGEGDLSQDFAGVEAYRPRSPFTFGMGGYVETKQFNKGNEDSPRSR